MKTIRVSLENFTNDSLVATHPDEQVAVISALGKNGRVRVAEWNMMPRVATPQTPPLELIELQIVGEPLDVRMKMVNDLDQDTDVLDSMFAIALRYARNWCDRAESTSDQDELRINLNKLVVRTHEHEQHVPNYFSGLFFQRNYANGLIAAVKDENVDDLRSLTRSIEQERSMIIEPGTLPPI